MQTEPEFCRKTDPNVFVFDQEQARTVADHFASRVVLVQSLNSPFFRPHIGAEPGREKEESRPRLFESRLTLTQG